MTLITYKPRTSIVNDIDSWFDSFWNLDYAFNRNINFNPDFDISEDESSYYITTDLPGMDKKDVDISVSEGVITITGERKSKKNQDTSISKYSQTRYGSFEKSFYVPEDFNADKINARMSSGVLILEIKKAEKIPVDIKKISIK